VSAAFWLDDKVRTLLDERGRYAFLHLLTCPNMTSVGAMRGTLAAEAVDLGWPLTRLQKALRPAIEAGMVEVNARVGYIGLPNFLKHNPPESPNVAKAWATALATLPECPEREALVARCWAKLGEPQYGPTFRKAFAEVYAEAFGQVLMLSLPARSSLNQEQEQEVLPGAGAGAGAGAGDAPPSPPSLHAVGSQNGPTKDEWPKVPTVVQL
jgi:hypothetical protein